MIGNKYILVIIDIIIPYAYHFIVLFPTIILEIFFWGNCSFWCPLKGHKASLIFCAGSRPLLLRVVLGFHLFTLFFQHMSRMSKVKKWFFVQWLPCWPGISGLSHKITWVSTLVPVFWWHRLHSMKKHEWVSGIYCHIHWNMYTLLNNYYVNKFTH